MMATGRAARPISYPVKCEVGGATSLADCLGLVARAFPAGIRRMPIGRFMRLPREGRMRAAMLQRPVDIGVDVGGEAELAARLQHARETVEVDRVHEAPLPVPFLGPWVGIEKVDPVERRFRQPVEQQGSIVVEDA